MRIGGEAFAVFESLLTLPAERRLAELEVRTAGRPELRAEVVRLLARDEEVGGIEFNAPLLGEDFHLLRVLDAASRPIRRFPVQVGRYLVHGEIGMGAMGIVYRAEQDQPRRMIALKLLLRGRDEALDQQVFRAEMQALAQVRHRGIVQIHDAGILECEGSRFPYLAMELVEGVALLEWERKAAPTRAQRISLLVDLCSAVEAAHQSGVIHRDLKPENVVVDTSGPVAVPRVLDFGIARLVQATAGVHPGEGLLLVGTPAYMSPEQAMGRTEVDTRSDVHALGAIAYRLLAGRDPFATAGKSLGETLRIVREDAPLPLGHEDRNLGGDIECVVAKAMAKDPAHRHASAREFGQDLAAILAHRPVSARRHTHWYLLQCLLRREPWKVAAALLGLVLVCAEVARSNRDEERAELALTKFVHQSRQNIVRIMDPLGRLAIAGAARREILEQMLPELQAALALRPGDPELLQTVYDVLRLLGDIVLDSGEFEAALELRLRALRALDDRLRAGTGTALDRAEHATALVRVGDVLAQLHGMPAAHAHHGAAHEIYLDLAAAAPGDERHLDDLAWSCDRMAEVALASGNLQEAEAMLARQHACIRQLEQVRPASPKNHAVLHALHCMQATLAERRGDKAGALLQVSHAVEAARARFQHEPGSRPAIIDLAAALLTHVHRSGAAMEESRAAEACQEATRVLEGLLAQEASHRVARKLLLWARQVPRIREAEVRRDPVETPIQQAASYLEHLRDARPLLDPMEIDTILDWVAQLLDDVPAGARDRDDLARLRAELAAAVNAHRQQRR